MEMVHFLQAKIWLSGMVPGQSKEKKHNFQSLAKFKVNHGTDPSDDLLGDMLPEALK